MNPAASYSCHRMRRTAWCQTDDSVILNSRKRRAIVIIGIGRDVWLEENSAQGGPVQWGR